MTVCLDRDVYEATSETAQAHRRKLSSLVNFLLAQAVLSGRRPPTDIPDGEEAAHV